MRDLAPIVRYCISFSKITDKFLEKIISVMAFLAKLYYDWNFKASIKE
jgi:hypothetical protein